MDMPQDWKHGTLEDLCSLKQDSCKPCDSGLNVYVGLEHIESGRFFVKSFGKPDQVVSSKSRFAINDVLYGKLRPYLDKATIMEVNGICSTDILVLTPKNRIPPIFVVGLLHTDEFIQYAKQTTNGVNHPRTSWSSLREFPIQIPPLSEQQKITAVLFKIQQAIEIQESIIEKTRELKKSTLHHVFTHGLRGEKLKETEIGPIPESWEAARVGKYCQKPEYGFTESAIADEIGPKFLRITDITENGVNWDTVPYCRCSQNLFPKYELKENDILFARIGATTGKSHIITNPPRAIFASYLIRLRPLYDLVPAYLYDFFNSEAYWNQVNANKKNNLKGGVNSSFLSDIIFPLPSKSEQIEIANIILTIDHKIEIYTAKKSALQDLFKTMLNKLMTGEIRVNDLDIDVSEVSA